jgi:histidyl-tRNA synthetase
LKWFSIGQFFRYEKQQRGRLREHYQLNCDIIGAESLAAETELLALAIDILRGFGFNESDFVVRVSDRSFWTDFLKEKGLPESQWQEVLQAIDKSERESREKTAEKLGSLGEPILRILQEGGTSGRLEELVDGLRVRGLDQFVDVDVRIVRGLAYYTGVVFEVFDRAGKLRAIAGGGRYDNLIGNLSDSAVSLPALGFAMGDVVLGELIRGKEEANQKAREFAEAGKKSLLYLVIAKEDRRGDALRYAQQLREAGWRVDYPFTAAKVGKQFQAAQEIGATVVVLFGDEWPNVAVKDLATGEQKLVSSEQLISTLNSRPASLG